MYDIQIPPSSSSCMTGIGDDAITVDTGPLIESGEFALKAFHLNGERLIRNLRFFHVMPPEAVEVHVTPYRPKAAHEETLPATEPAPAVRVDEALRLFPDPPGSMDEPVSRKRGTWRLLGRKTKRKQPSFRMMMAEFVITGRVELFDMDPRYEERKAYLLSRGFHYDGKLKAWILDPDQTPASA